MEADLTSYTTAELKATKASLIGRLRAVAIKAIAAVETITELKTPLECERMAKAILTLEKVVEKLFGEEDDAEAGEDERHGGRPRADIHEYMERKLAGISIARRSAGVGQEPNAEQLAAFRRQLGILDEGGRADAP